MSIFNYPKRKYLALIPILFLLLNAFYFQYATEEIQKAMLKQKLLEVTDATNMLAAAVEGNEERFWLDHELNIKNSAEFLDKLYQIYGAAYKQTDNGLELITDRSYETSPFEPLEYPEFVEAVTGSERGNLIINYAPENQDYRDLHIYFRWMPLYSPENERFLVIAGVSKYSIITKISTLVSVGQWVNTLITFLLNMVLIIMLARLGYIYDQRTGDKWRGKRKEGVSNV